MIFGKKAGLDGTDFPALCRHIEKRLGIDLGLAEHSHKKEALRHTFERCFESFDGGKTFVLRPEYDIKLAELRALETAQAAATTASRTGIAAVCISAAATIFCAIMAFWLVSRPAGMTNDELLSLLEARNSVRTPLEIKLNNLQMAQLVSAVSNISISETHKPKAPAKKEPPATKSNELIHHELINRYFVRAMISC